MAKVNDPLFIGFCEAFADSIVYQRNAHGDIYARMKVKHPTEPRSAHYPTNIPKWADAVDQHQADGASDAELVDYVVDYAIPPNSPSNIQCSQLIDDPADPTRQQFTITWDAPTTKWNGWPLRNLVGYFIEYTQDHVTWTRLNATPHTSEELTASVPDGDVWLNISAVDANDNVSIPSPEFYLEVTVQPLAPPRKPTNLTKVFVNICTQHPDCWHYKFSWIAPTLRTDGTQLDGLAGYFIEHSFDNVLWIRLNTTPVTDTFYEAHCQNVQQLRRVIALDLYDNESEPSNPLLIRRGFF